MIGLVAAIVGGAIMNFYLPAVLPGIYLLKKISKDLALFAFFAYVIGIGYLFEVNTLYSYNGVLAIFTIAIPHILVLDSILRDGFRDFNVEGIVFSLLLAVSYLYVYAFVVLVVAALLLRFYGEFGRKEFAYSIGVTGTLALFLYYFREYFENDYTSQVVALASMSAIAFSLLVRKEIKRERMF